MDDTASDHSLHQLVLIHGRERAREMVSERLSAAVRIRA